MADAIETFDDYQRETTRTAGQFLSFDEGLTLAALGIGGEGGEVVDLVKKYRYHGRDLDLEKLKLELGDVLWYIAQAARVLGLSLSEVATANIRKLEARYPNGFKREDAHEQG